MKTIIVFFIILQNITTDDDQVNHYKVITNTEEKGDLFTNQTFKTGDTIFLLNKENDKNKCKNCKR